MWKYLLHNHSTAQATGSRRGGFYTGSDTVSEDGYEFVNGGPGFRVDSSAFYPVKIKAGSPVALLNPKSAVRQTPASFKFAGVLNPSGSDEKTAQHNADWN